MAEVVTYIVKMHVEEGGFRSVFEITAEDVLSDETGKRLEFVTGFGNNLKKVASFRAGDVQSYEIKKEEK